MSELQLSPVHSASLSAPTRFANALIDVIDCGLLMCDEHGTLLYANRAARRELSDGNALEIRAGHVRCRRGPGLELEAMVRDAALRRRCRMAWIGEVPSQLTVVAMPFASDQPALSTALLVIGPRTLCSPLALAMLTARYRLTWAEHRVLQALLTGRSPREIASDQSVGLPTIRTHIQAIREKIGVRSIDELLILVARVPPVSSL